MQEGGGATVQQLQVSRVPNAICQQDGAGHSLPADQGRSQLGQFTLLFFFLAPYELFCRKRPLSQTDSSSSVADVYAVLAPHDAAQPVRRRCPPEDPQTQSAARLPRVRRRGPAGQLSDPHGGGLPALRQAHRLQVRKRVPET